jgi:hypothetical protein
VDQEEAGSMVPEGRIDYLPGIDAAGREGPLREGFYGDDPVLGVQKHDLEDFALLVSQGEVKIVKEFCGRSNGVFLDKPLFQISAGHCVDELDTEYVSRPDPFDFLELFSGRFNDALKGLETL